MIPPYIQGQGLPKTHAYDNINISPKERLNRETANKVNSMVDIVDVFTFVPLSLINVIKKTFKKISSLGDSIANKIIKEFNPNLDETGAKIKNNKFKVINPRDFYS